MTNSEFISHYPKLYHLAHRDAWPRIRKSGLLSTTALLDLFEYSGKRRHQIESCRRPEAVEINHPVLGKAVIRDQKVLHPTKLGRCLEGITEKQYYRLLNSKVFFWASWDRCEKLLNGRAYRDGEHIVLTVDTRRLVTHYGDSMHLCRKNSGQTRSIHPLGPDIFKTIEQYDQKVSQRTGKPQKPVAEVAVKHSVPKIGAVVDSVHEVKSGGRGCLIWCP